MSDRFICIACWQEFMVTAAEQGSRGGKVVCPHCGYVQTATSMPGSSSKAEAATVADLPAASVPTTKAASKGVLAPEPVRSTAGYEGGLDDEDADPQLGEESTSELPEDPDEFDGEPTPPLGVTPPFDPDEADAPYSSEESDFGNPATITQRTVMPAGDPIPESPAQFIWQLKTSSGLKLKFNDMESLLGWRQKVSSSSQAEISPDGQRWTDFSAFIRHYEDIGDPWQAFLRAANLDADEPPPPTASTISQTTLRTLTSQSGEQGMISPANGSKPIAPRPGYSSDALNPTLTSKATAPQQFTFQVTQKPKPAVGKKFAFVVLGALLVAGAVVALLYFSEQL